jgi:hypothetical protein
VVPAVSEEQVVKIRKLKRRKVAAMLAGVRINFELHGVAAALFARLTQRQRESFVDEALRRYVRQA